MHLIRLIAVLAAILAAACGETTEDNAGSTAAVELGAQATEAEAEDNDTTPTEANEPAPTATREPEATATTAPTQTPTPKPEPTNTPRPSPTPKPPNTPTPVPPTATATPPPQPTIYSGSGANVIDIQKPGDADDPVLVYVRGNAESGYFGVESYDANGEQVDLLVNTTEVYEGVVLMDAREGEVTTRLQVTAEGEWYIEIRPLPSARRVSVPGTISGTSDDVFIVDGDPDTAHIVGNAEGRYFGVVAYGDSSDLLVNTTDPFDGRVIVSRDTVLIEVSAVGSWEIIFE